MKNIHLDSSELDFYQLCKITTSPNTERLWAIIVGFFISFHRFWSSFAQAEERYHTISSNFWTSFPNSMPALQSCYLLAWKRGWVEGTVQCPKQECTMELYS